MNSTDIKIESLDETIQTVKQLIARAERHLADICNATGKNRPGAVACRAGDPAWPGARPVSSVALGTGSCRAPLRGGPDRLKVGVDSRWS